MMLQNSVHRPVVNAQYAARSGSIQYIVSCANTRQCAIIDPVLDYDPNSGSVATFSADALLAHVTDHHLQVSWILDSHPHADHLSAAHYLKTRTGARTAIGRRVTEVQSLWKKIYGSPDAFPVDGSQWDVLFADGDCFEIGDLAATAILTPGHTLCSIAYLVGDAAFINDTMFMPDTGTARADFPGGSAALLWRSIKRILELPADTRLFTGHDYRHGGREAAWESTIDEQRASNLWLQCLSEAEFVEKRARRDATLPVPVLMLHAMQVNINAGRLPAPDDKGRRFLRIPLDCLPHCNW